MAGGAAEKTQPYTPIRSARSDGKGYDYGSGIDEKTKTKACEDPTIDARWRIHLGGYLKRELATGEHTGTFSACPNDQRICCVLTPLQRRTMS
jgi:hypothetical protein